MNFFRKSYSAVSPPASKPSSTNDAPKPKEPEYVEEWPENPITPAILVILRDATGKFIAQKLLLHATSADLPTHYELDGITYHHERSVVDFTNDRRTRAYYYPPFPYFL